MGLAGFKDAGIARHRHAVDVAAFAEGREHARSEEWPGGGSASADDVEGQIEGIDQVGEREAEGKADFVEDAERALVASDCEMGDGGGGEGR